MKPLLILLFVIITCFISCKTDKPKETVDFINPLIGTGGHGHTYPGATVPFGMVQLSPDTRKDSWDGCSGYHYSDSAIYGFSHTHLSGTGIGDYGDIRLMPTVGELNFNPAYGNPASGYGSRFEHQRETAQAGFYAVHLNDYDIYVGLTATEHAGFHQYLFPSSQQAHILLDLVEGVITEKIIESRIEFLSDTEISGLRRTSGWANDQYVYFYAKFSKPFESFGILKDSVPVEGLRSAVGGNLKAWVDFSTEAGEAVLAKVGISAVDNEGAKNNLIEEIPGWDFQEVKEAARRKWAVQMKKIEAGGGTPEQKETFYTALYHTMLAPNLYSDVDGRFRGHDHQIHRDTSFSTYTVFSLWDTFRTLHPLFTLVERERTTHLIRSMLDMYRHDSLLPVWELAANETNCMIGYHAVPVIVDAYKKGIRGFDAKLALEAMQSSAGADQFGLTWLRQKGYIPADREGSSVSKTLEYAYNDWCIAEMAKMMDAKDVYNEYIERAQYFKNLFDHETGFFRGKSNGSFVEPFDPTEVNFMLTEANTWQYNFFVPQDINTHIDLLGGDAGYEAKLDELFTSDAGLAGRQQSDITGLIGQYAHGNEPSHHMAYLYNYVGKPWKTQEIVWKIMDEMYSDQPDGLSGNEDCGQMSAWYVMSAMGFYPVTPGTDVYVLGKPLFDSLQINLENGNEFRIKALYLSGKNHYVQAVRYNGEPWTKSYIKHDIIMQGGLLEFEMGPSPNKAFGNETHNRPYQKITDNLITPVPYFKAQSKTFEDSMKVEIVGLNNEPVRWGMVSGEGRPAMQEYTGPLEINRTTRMIAVAAYNGQHSIPEEAEWIRIPPGRTATIVNPYSSQYTAGGDHALINTLRGGEDFTTGNWQGYQGVDLDITIDLGEEAWISEIGAGFLQDENSWIFMPQWVAFETSTDGINFTDAGKIETVFEPQKSGAIIHDFTVKTGGQPVRYIRVHAKNIGLCPAWHKGAGEPAWIFVDEVWWK